MGTPSNTKYIKNSAGNLAEESAILDTVGAADSNKIPALGATGVLHPTILNATNTSAGVADSGKTVILDASGRISSTMMPAGTGTDSTTLTTTEALNAGDFVNIYNISGNARVRKADASTNGKSAHGYVLESYGNGVPATVYFEGTNSSVTGQTPGDVYLSATTPGLATSTAPSAPGQIIQYIGIATSATSINFEAGRPLILA